MIYLFLRFHDSPPPSSLFEQVLEVIYIWTLNEAWNKKAPGVLWDLIDCKYTQNPPLLKKLIATSPHRLVEGTLDSKWGGGAHYGADTYNQGIVPGKNLFGDMAISYRDQKIEQNSLINALV